MSNKLPVKIELYMFMKEDETKEEAIERVRDTMLLALVTEEDMWITKYNFGEVEA